MEVGKAATHSPAAQYARRWDAVNPKDPFYSADVWRDRGFSAITASTAQTWSDCSAISAPSPSPSVSSGLALDSGVDKELFHNLVEMIPLVETFMEQKQSSRSFPRHASLVYTPNPRDSSKSSEYCFKANKRHGQLFKVVSVVLAKDNLVEQNTIIAQLQDQVEILEQKVLEKDSQLQSVENSIKQEDLYRLQTSVEELQDQILFKEDELEKTVNQLSNVQQEVTSLQSQLQKAELDVKASDLNVSKVQGETHNLQTQVAALLLWIESISSQVHNEPADEELEDLLKSADVRSMMVTGRELGNHGLKVIDADCMSAELTRRKYSAALIAAKHNPTDELLALVAEFRGELQSSLLPSENGIWN